MLQTKVPPHRCKRPGACHRKAVSMREHLTLEERFWSNVVKADGCWSWSGSIHPYGYGTLGSRQQRVLAHRLSWMLHNGPIPNGLWVLHRCDNPPCTNPSHLFLGTHQDNMDDMKSKGRGHLGEAHGLFKHPERRARGERHGNTHLAAEDVLEIRRRAGTEDQRVVAADYGISQTTVSRILNRVVWGHV